MLDDVGRRARERGDETTAERARALQGELDDSRRETERLTRRLNQAADANTAGEDAGRDRDELQARVESAALRLRRLNDERARLLGDALPVGRIRDVRELQESLRDGELFLHFTIDQDASWLFAFARDGDVEAYPLPGAYAALVRTMPQGESGAALSLSVPVRGRDPDGALARRNANEQSRELFRALIPADLWARLVGSRRLFVSAHRYLHHVPLEALVVEMVDQEPVYWLDRGPAVAYVPSASVLQWVRGRSASRPRQPHRMTVLAIGDPEQRIATERPQSAAVPPTAKRGNTRVSRRWQTAVEGSERLPKLEHARQEAMGIVAMALASGGSGRALLGPEADKSTVFQLAGTASHLHFACHGVACQYAANNASMLLLASPPQDDPFDDGMLKLTDLLHDWRGKLKTCELVVLSACRTNIGPTFRDDAPNGLPFGFLLAGSRAVISTLWAVDDASTRELMVDFYQRLLRADSDKLAAFTAAKRTLRRTYPDPFHWAAFLFLGDPD